jgi:hypothetical protein
LATEESEGEVKDAAFGAVEGELGDLPALLGREARADGLRGGLTFETSKSKSLT